MLPVRMLWLTSAAVAAITARVVVVVVVAPGAARSCRRVIAVSSRRASASHSRRASTMLKGWGGVFWENAEAPRSDPQSPISRATLRKRTCKRELGGVGWLG
jgi:hypothetical protein